MKRGSINPHLWRARIGNCILCGKEFRAIKDSKNHKQKYCSKECWSKRNPPVNKKCLFCGIEFKSYQRIKKYCNLNCRNKGMIGRKLTRETRQKMSKAMQGYTPVNIFKSGEKHPFWKEDRRLINVIDTKEYKELRLKVFRRDNYTCQICKGRGGKGKRIILEMHHIKPKKDYPELFWEMDNCQTVCHECHKKTESYLKRW